MKKIIYEKDWYLPTFLDNRIRHGKPTGDYSGYLMGHSFVVFQTKKGRQLRREVRVWSFSGKSDDEMVAALRRLVRGKKMLPDKADGNPQFVPPEVMKIKNSKLL